MTNTETEYEFSEDDFPDLDITELVHLQRQHNMHDRERVTRWIRNNVAIPIQYQVDDDFDDADADAYYEALTDYYLNEDED